MKIQQNFNNEKIDIGGPAMVRAAAKNFKHTVVMTDPKQYDQLSLKNLLREQSKEFAAEAFSLTTDYDLDVSNWFLDNPIKEESKNYGTARIHTKRVFAYWK